MCSSTARARARLLFTRQHSRFKNPSNFFLFFYSNTTVRVTRIFISFSFPCAPDIFSFFSVIFPPSPPPFPIALFRLSKRTSTGETVRSLEIVFQNRVANGGNSSSRVTISRYRDSRVSPACSVSTNARTRACFLTPGTFQPARFLSRRAPRPLTGRILREPRSFAGLSPFPRFSPFPLVSASLARLVHAYDEYAVLI